MNAITDLKQLLCEMHPVLHPETFVFVTIPSLTCLNPEDTFAIISEKEGWTLILEAQKADAFGFLYQETFHQITLEVNSSLVATGFTAAFSTALAKNDIACNVVAGFYHDHLFVPVRLAGLAMETLSKLGKLKE